MVRHAACVTDEAETPETLRLMAHDSFVGSVNEETFAPFTEPTGIEVEMIAAGDAGSMVNQAAFPRTTLSPTSCSAWTTFLSRALEEEIFASARAASGMSASEARSRDDVVTPIDFETSASTTTRPGSRNGTPVPTSSTNYESPSMPRRSPWNTRPHLHRVWPSCWHQFASTARRAGSSSGPT